jgi:hypothetical protein
MTSAQRLAQRYAADSKAPARLMAIVRRSVTGGYPEYRHLAGAEDPHLFTFKASMKFAVNVADLKVLIRNGFSRIQVNDPGQITLYFTDPKASDDEERHDGPANDMKGKG